MHGNEKNGKYNNDDFVSWYFINVHSGHMGTNGKTVAATLPDTNAGSISAAKVDGIYAIEEGFLDSCKYV